MEDGLLEDIEELSSSDKEVVVSIKPEELTGIWAIGHRPVGGRGRPIKHGLYSKWRLGPLEDGKLEEIVEIMQGEHLAIGRADMIFIRLLARLLAQIDLLDKFFTQYGLLSDIKRGQPWPILTIYQGMLKQAGQMLEQLGMTTSGRSKLGRSLLQEADIAMRIQKERQDRQDR